MSQVMQSVEPQGREAELEMELGAEELLELSRRPAPRHTAAAPALAAQLPPPNRRRLSRIQIGAGAATLLAVLVGIALDRSPGAGQPARAAPIAPPPVAALVPAPAAPVAAPLPVKFANPFDRSEVFEFPAGTSKTEARARVADLLMKRAQERRAQYKRVAPRHTRVASR
jgi:hypothetical protein